MTLSVKLSLLLPIAKGSKASLPRSKSSFCLPSPDLKTSFFGLVHLESSAFRAPFWIPAANSCFFNEHRQRFSMMSCCFADYQSYFEGYFSQHASFKWNCSSFVIFAPNYSNLSLWRWHLLLNSTPHLGCLNYVQSKYSVWLFLA